ncbi:hypothetical protein DCC85_09600 [Paenibacillus sp. CAA11]|uniref:hypothetical protein n=1 Tax=Paenibacillus sp. CAA11 TaxID=1532905 RepID=UPI000D378CEF|nr:hypothetical protein [Paenibacillus sp. CAA11]AWB44455.1 hypothetical protein DCC85_09600 [Paenibacillus sp. CAA11]
MRLNKGYFYFLLWIAGAILLLYYGNDWMDSVNANSSKNKTDYIRMAGILYPVVLGAYVSLLIGIPNKWRPHKPLLLAVFLPAFLLFVYPTVGQYIKLPELPLYTDVFKYQGRFLFGVVSGMSLLQGLFEVRR